MCSSDPGQSGSHQNIPSGSPDRNLPFVSVVIPTYNRSVMLKTTLDSFVVQNYPKHRYEIIVCNNNSSDDTEQILKDYQYGHRDLIKILHEKRQGVHFARNSAAHRTCGDILYYTDDDMLADPNLLDEIVKPFQLDENVASATGRVLPIWESTPPDWVMKLCNNFLLSLNDRGDSLEISDDDPGVFSCHQAVRREAFFKTGGFNPENTAGEWIGDGETGLNIRFREMGCKFAYNGKAIIYHMIPRTRMTQDYLNRRLSNQGNCDSYTEYRRLRPSSEHLLQHVLKCRTLISQHLDNYIALKNDNNDLWRVEMARVHYFMSRIEYDFRLIQDENWREMVLKDDWLHDERISVNKV